MLFHAGMEHTLTFADVAVRPDGNYWVVVDYANRRLLGQRFQDPDAAITLGLLVARRQGGAVWIDDVEPTSTTKLVAH